MVQHKKSILVEDFLSTTAPTSFRKEGIIMKKVLFVILCLISAGIMQGCNSTETDQVSNVIFEEEIPEYPQTVSTYIVEVGNYDYEAFRERFVRDDRKYFVKIADPELGGYKVGEKFPKKTGKKIKQEELYEDRTQTYDFYKKFDEVFYPDEDITISPNFDQLHYETLEGRVLFYWIDEPLTEYETDDLSFATKEEATKEVKNVLEQIGIAVSEQVEIYTCNQKYYERANKENAEEYKYNGTKMESLETVFAGTNAEWDYRKIKDCYYMKFAIGTGGLEICDGKQINIENRVDKELLNYKIEVIYSENGIEYMDVENAYVLGETIEKDQKVISYEDSLEELKQEYRNVITDDGIVFPHGELVYMMEKKEDTVMIYPVWLYKGYDPVLGKTMVDGYTIRCQDAITGEWIQ